MNKYETDSAVLKALGHPARLKIVVELSKGNGCNVNDIADNMELPQSTVSQHLSILKSHNIITPEKNGVKTCYKVTDSRVLQIISILNS